MDTNELYEHGLARFEHASARRVLREKYQAKMVFAHAGGMWQAGPELLTLLAAMVMEDDVVIMDLYQNPVRVRASELRYLAFARWQEQMTAWLIEHEEINRKR